MNRATHSTTSNAGSGGSLAAPQDLLAHTGRMRALAQRLLRDAAAADDVVQSALSLALQRGGAPEGREGPWLMTVVRNLVTDQRRRVARTTARERHAARPEATMETAEAAAIAERQRDVATAVLELQEPYRSVLLLRFFEELPPRSIAKRLGRTSATVQQQVRRGLELLRQKLESSYGDRSSWAVAMLPLAGRDALKLGAAAGGGAFGVAGLTWTKVLVPLALVVAIIAAVVYGAVGPEALPGPAGTAGAQGARADLTVPAATNLEKLAQASPRAELAGAGEALPLDSSIAAVGSPVAAARTTTFEARLVDLYGAPLPGVEAQWNGRLRNERMRALLGLDSREGTKRLVMESDSQGWIRSDAVAGTPTADEAIDDLASHVDQWRVVDGGAGPDGEIVVVMAPCVRMAGRVVEANGDPVPKASVRVEGRLDGLTTFDIELTDTRYRSIREAVETGPAGEFDFGWAPAHPDFRLSVVRKGSGRIQEFALPMEGNLALELPLAPVAHRRSNPRPNIFGRVVHADGSAAAFAAVALGRGQARADADGMFWIRSWSPTGTLVARVRDGRFTVKAGLSQEEAMLPGGSGPHVLTIPERMTTLAVQVVDHDLRPAAGLLVIPIDGTTFGGDIRYLETAPLGGQSDFGASTDRRGVALFTHMLDRDYKLRVIDQETMFTMDFEPTPAGQGLQRIVLPEGPLVGALTGFVFDHYGAPIEGADVTVMARVFAAHGTTSQLTGQPILTDSSGYFEIKNAPRKRVSVRAASPTDDYASADIELDGILSDGPLRFTLDLMCEVILELEGEPEVDRVKACTADGTEATLIWIGPSATMYDRDVPRGDDGSFPVIHISQSATEIILLDGKKEVRRVTLRPDPQGRTRVLL